MPAQPFARQKQVLELLQKHPEGLDGRQICERTSIRHQSQVVTVIRRLMDQGLVRRDPVTRKCFAVRNGQGLKTYDTDQNWRSAAAKAGMRNRRRRHENIQQRIDAVAAKAEDRTAHWAGGWVLRKHSR